MELIKGSALENSEFVEQVIQELRAEVEEIRERAVYSKLKVAIGFAAVVALCLMANGHWYGGGLAFLVALGAAALLAEYLPRMSFAARFLRKDEDLWADVLQSWAFDTRPENRNDVRPIVARQLLVFYLVKRLNQIDGTEYLQRGLNRYFMYRGKRELPLRWRSLSVETSLRALRTVFGRITAADMRFLWERGLRVETFNAAENCREFIQLAWEEDVCDSGEMKNILECLENMSSNEALCTYAQISA